MFLLLKAEKAVNVQQRMTGFGSDGEYGPLPHGPRVVFCKGGRPARSYFRYGRPGFVDVEEA